LYALTYCAPGNASEVSGVIEKGMLLKPSVA
jgi:hypothetical protein